MFCISLISLWFSEALFILLCYGHKKVVFKGSFATPCISNGSYNFPAMASLMALTKLVDLKAMQK
jgi:hypothetical protein